MGLFTHLFGSTDDELSDEFIDDLALVSAAESEAALDEALRVADPNDQAAMISAYFAALREMRGLG